MGDAVGKLLGSALGIGVGAPTVTKVRDTLVAVLDAAVFRVMVEVVESTAVTVVKAAIPQTSHSLTLLPVYTPEVLSRTTNALFLVVEPMMTEVMLPCT